MTSDVSDYKNVSKIRGVLFSERKCAWSGSHSSIIRSSTASKVSHRVDMWVGRIKVCIHLFTKLFEAIRPTRLAFEVAANL